MPTVITNYPMRAGVGMVNQNSKDVGHKNKNISLKMLKRHVELRANAESSDKSYHSDNSLFTYLSIITIKSHYLTVIIIIAASRTL